MQNDDVRPARKIIRRGHGSFIGLFPTRKSSRPLAYESTLERDLLYHLEVRPEVSDVRSQPTRLRYHDGSIARIHVPDFSYLDGTSLTYVEVKPADRVTSLIQRRTEILARQLLGVARYRLLTEVDIRTQPDLRNAIALCDGIDQQPGPLLRREILRLLADASGPVEIEQLRVALAEPESFLYRVYSLILDGEVVLANPSMPVGRHALVTLKQPGGQDA